MSQGRIQDFGKRVCVCVWVATKTCRNAHHVFFHLFMKFGGLPPPPRPSLDPPPRDIGKEGGNLPLLRIKKVEWRITFHVLL